jgi:hypothetical protein
MSQVARPKKSIWAPSLYHYFASKDALFAAVARTVLTPGSGSQAGV